MTTSGPAAPEPSPGSDLSSGVENLACGADVDELLEQVADGHAEELTDHQSGCGYCQAALTEFTALWSPVAQAAAAPFAVPIGLAGTLTAAVMADIAKFPTPPATPSPAPTTGGLPLQRWLPQLLAVLAVAAIVTVIVLVSHHHGPRTSGTVPLATAASSFIGAPTTSPPTAPPPRSAPEAAPPPPSTASSRGYPTAVPAGTGGQAASTMTGTRDEQLAMLLAGVVLIAAGGGYLIRHRRWSHAG